MYNRDVQPQNGIDDCGLFVLACIHTSCKLLFNYFSLKNIKTIFFYKGAGLNPSYLNFDQGSMRTHLNKCLTNSRFDPFPSEARNKQKLHDTQHYFDSRYKNFVDPTKLRKVY
jgi:hypothetical protein